MQMFTSNIWTAHAIIIVLSVIRGDYIWATYDDVPFSELVKPLSELRIALVTTATPLDFDGVKPGVVGPCFATSAEIVHQ